MAKKKSITIDQAVDMMTAPPEQGGSTAAQATQPDCTDDDAAADNDTGDNNSGDTDTDVDADVDDGAPLSPPNFWDTASKARFGEIPRDLQKVILAKEDARNAVTSRALQHLAERRKAHEQMSAHVSNLMTGLDQLMPQAARTFRNRWANMDWSKVASRIGADQALKLRAQHETENALMHRLHAAKQAGNRHAFQRFVMNENARLPQHAPDLVHPQHGAMRKGMLARFLTRLGLPAERLAILTAPEAGLAYDAMKWRNAKQDADSLVNAPKQPGAKRLPVKQTGGVSPKTPTQARMDALSRKKELSVDEAVELADLKGY